MKDYQPPLLNYTIQIRTLLVTKYYNVNFLSFYIFFKKVFGTEEELKIVIFYPNTKLRILFVISGQTTLFFNQFPKFPNFFNNVNDVVL